MTDAIDERGRDYRSTAFVPFLPVRPVLGFRMGLRAAADAVRRAGAAFGLAGWEPILQSVPWKRVPRDAEDCSEDGPTMSDDSNDSKGGVEFDSLEAALHRELAPVETADGVSPFGNLPGSFDPPVEIGVFTIDERIGAGGMGAVYQGAHRGTGMPVALKVVHQPTDEEHRRRFHEEVQSHARLIHPGIVHLFEYGTVDSSADASEEPFEPGWPYIAMELAEGGTVRDVIPPSNWGEVYEIAVQFLDALGYAHARGVIHRDLKPENFLVFEAETAAFDRRIKLADFGIAHAFGEESTRDTAALGSPIGTPLYMAPEQFGGNWRQYRPWTDLYGVGCIVWELVCGEPPLDGDELNFVEMSLLHQDAERPPLEPNFPVPRRLEAWIHRCMAVDPERRFRRAADALWNLPRTVGNTTPMVAVENETSSRHETGGPEVGDTADGARHLPTFETTLILEGADEAFAQTIPDVDAPRSELDDATDEAADRTAPMQRPPTPETWRRERTEPLPAPLVGAGLGLFGLREPPFVDRDRERDRIWRALREAEDDGVPRVVLVVGDSGSGKSRLVEWMVARSHELGAAQTMRCVQTPGGRSVGEGLPGMVRRVVRGQKLDRGEFYEHLLDELPPLGGGTVDRETDARALTELVFPTARDADTVDGPRYEFSSPDQKCALVARLLRRYSRNRLPFVWLDDAHWGDLSLAFAAHLLESAYDAPSGLAAAALRSDVLAEDEDLRERVENLAASEHCLRIDIDALSPADHREFVDRMLPLQQDLVERLTVRTEGNPLFATQLLGHVIENGRLQATDEGFRLPGDATLDLPETIHELWMRRVDVLVDDLGVEPPEQAWSVLERGAALGREIDGAEWRALCDDADFERPNEIREELLERGLAERTDDGWAFAHGLLVDSLERRARTGGRWSDHNRACVRVLKQRQSDQPGRTPIRLADHYIEAGDLKDALEPLVTGVMNANRSGDAHSSLEILERRRELLDALDLDENDPRRLENAIYMEGFRSVLGADPVPQIERLEESIRRAEQLDRNDLAAEAALLAGSCARRAGTFERASEFFEAGRDHGRRAGERLLRTRSLLQLGWLENIRGNLEESARSFSEGSDQARKAEAPYWEAYAQYGLAWVKLAGGETAGARALFENVLESSGEAGFRELGAECLNGLGDLDRYAGDADGARDYYRQKCERAREMSRPAEEATARLNLVQVELMDGHFEDAAERLREAERGLRQTGRSGRHPDIIRLCRLVHAAGTDDFAAFDQEWARYDEGWPEEASLVRDHPWLLEMAGDHAADGGARNRAERVWRLGRELWAELGDDAAVERVDEKLA